MPKTPKQELLFTLLMVPVMVLFMVSFNNYMAEGAWHRVSLLHILYEALIMGCIALAVEFPIIAPAAHRLAFSIINPASCKPVLIPLVISICTVCIMCPFMSCAATLILRQPALHEFVPMWLNTLAMNFPMALSWQLCVAGPLVRRTFRLIMQRQAVADPYGVRKS